MVKALAKAEIYKSPPASKPKQGELFHADLRYITLLSSLYSSGIAAQVGPLAVSTLICLRIHADFRSGNVTIGQRRIAEQVGCSPASVNNAIKTLVSFGLVTVVENSHGRRSHYTITDKVPVFHEDQLAREMQIPFVPTKSRDHLEDARNSLIDGRNRGSVRLYNFTINVINAETVNINNVNVGADATSFNVNLDSLPTDIRENFKRMLRLSQTPDLADDDSGEVID